MTRFVFTENILFFPNVHGTVTKASHIQGYKKNSLNSQKKTDIAQTTFSDNSEMKLVLNKNGFKNGKNKTTGARKASS